MTQLDCTVTSCLYNHDCLCAKGNITIGGRDATKSGETCCESFRERGTNTLNWVGQTDPAVEIDCEACDCVHNEDCKCAATHIGIGGGSSACQCRETECEDFRCR
ncbi:MAG: DUF1540 domain-containing protein [Clostridiales bacterium]|nr:DUF1540 domain-containing protein [Clostridiales bacterium]MCD8324919.1 DUF1540 domain-containing protein [Clostridiales bacterium]MCD8333505.1 DUF1540 domain-containing protein [Clostridiales bacterium]